MKKQYLVTFLFLIPLYVFSQTGYKIGEEVEDFLLVNAKDKSNVSLGSFPGSKVVVLVFTSNNCPYPKIYENRANKYVKDYSNKGVIFISINSNNPDVSPEDSPESMSEASEGKPYLTYYVSDRDQKIADKFGATKNPEVFVLKNNNGKFVLKYKGAIDDNPQSASDVSAVYMRDALEAILNNQPVKIAEKRASGCTIKR